MDDSNGVDICRVCRSEGVPERPLFHPCICTGSIKWIHQECLVQWMRYSRKEYCELCSHSFSFTPIYSPDMPRRLPVTDVIHGLLSRVATALKYWVHYSLVAFAWLGVVPVTACRIYRCLFSGSVDSIITLPYDILKTENLLSDVFHGCFVITCTFFAFFGMIWLREQIVQDGAPHWLEPEHEAQPAQQPEVNQQQVNDNQPSPEEDDHAQQQSEGHSSLNTHNIYNSTDRGVTSGGANNVVNSSGASQEVDSAGVSENFSVHPATSSNNAALGGTLNKCKNNNSSNSNSSEMEYNRNDCHSDNFSSSDIPNEDSESGACGRAPCEKNLPSSKARNNNSSSTSNESSRHVTDLSDLHRTGNEFINNDNHSDGNGESEFGVHRDRFEERVDNINLNQFQNENEDADPVRPAAIERNQMDEMEGGAEAPDRGENAQEDGNWNPVEWDRAVEELTWERLLGLDGSMVFMQHVFWVIVINIVFTFVFAFFPYHFGNFAIDGLGLQEIIAVTHFEGLISTLCGYCIIGIGLVVLHAFASLLRLHRYKRFLGFCYIIVKVSLLCVVEIGVFPLICGWWLDVCSLSMFDATFKDRETSFRLAPGTSVFIHWLVGMIYVYYFASFVVLLREVVRPGVLWFLINLNDPDFSPVQEMINTPIMHHVRRILASVVIFGTAVLLTFWFPVRVIRYLWPSFLPYAIALQIEGQINGFSLEFLLLQVILPSLMEQSHTRTWMKSLLKLWCKCAAWLFGIRSYLLGDEMDQNGNGGQPENNENNQGLFNGLGAVHHQALLPREGPIDVQPYEKPSWFCARLTGLILTICISLITASVIVLTVPVWIGRRIMSFWLIGIPNPSAKTIIPFIVGEEASIRVHDLYTTACGTYVCWFVARAVTLLRSWIPHYRVAIFDAKRLKQWFILGAKALIAFTFLLGVIPLLFGLLLELIIVIPSRVELYQTPVLFVWHDWALGVLYTKIACAMILMGPDCNMRRAIERVYRDGIRNMDLPFILRDLVIPVTTGFSLALAVPYATAHSVIPLITSDVHIKNFAIRMAHPCVLIFFISYNIIAFQVRQFKKLYEHIKNDKYLVGKRLVNYYHRRSKSSDGV